jgi:hypothetical protein
MKTVIVNPVFKDGTLKIKVVKKGKDVDFATIKDVDRDMIDLGVKRYLLSKSREVDKVVMSKSFKKPK